MSPVRPIDMLREDHQSVQELFERFEDADAEGRREIASVAIRELKIHMTIEEEIFYPAFRQETGESDLLDGAFEEHHVAKLLIEELEAMDSSHPHFTAKFRVLAESVRHHIREEESEMFSKAEQADLDDLGDEMTERKLELHEEFDSGKKSRRPRRARSAQSRKK